MTAFYVGQRVRFIACLGDAALNARKRAREGMEATVISHGPPNTKCSDECEYGIAFADGFEGGVLACQIQPASNPGRQVISWADCLWQPEGVAA